MQKIVAKIFQFLQKFGINLLPKHFYSNIPDFSSMAKEHFWKKELSMVGVNGADIKSQLEFVGECIDSISNKSILSGANIHNTAIEEQKEYGYGIIESDFLYAFVIAQKPKKIVQIGCGVSTSIILRACKAIDHKPQIVCVEPYPSNYLKDLDQKGIIKLVSEKAQVFDPEKVTNLDSGDLFFVDSTHTVKPGSEVNRIILEFLPRLNKGVFVHFHDIFFPFDYQRNLMETVFFWSESTLLHAYLINNSSCTIRVSQSMLHYKAKSELKKLFPNYTPQEDDHGLPNKLSKELHFPSSTYLQII